MSKLRDPFDSPERAVAKPKLSDPFSVLPSADSSSEASRRGYETVGQYGDGTVYRDQYGEMQFVSPGYSTGDPEAIRRIMSGGEQVGIGEGAARAAYQGFTFGAGDEATAGMAGLMDYVTNRTPGNPSLGDLYGGYLARERSKLEQFGDERPILSTAAEIGGAIAPAIVAPVVGGAEAAAGLIPNMAKAAGIAGAEGSVYGFNQGEDGFLNRAYDAGKTGGVSAVVGALSVPVGRGASNIAKRIATNPKAKASGMSRPTYDAMVRATGAENTDRVLSELADPTTVLADTSKAGRKILDAAIQSSGAAGAAAARVLDDRVTQASKSYDAALNEAFGAPGASASRELVPYGQKDNPATPLYDMAYAKPIDYTTTEGRQILDMVRDRVPSQAIKVAKNMMKVEGEASRQMFAEIADDGTVKFTRLPDVRELDYLTHALNEVADEADGKGKLGGTTRTGRAYSNLSRDIRSRLRTIVPEYDRALKVAKNMIGNFTAKEFGEILLRPSVTRSEVQKEIAKWTPAQKARAAESMRMFIDDMVANTKKAFTDTNMDAREAATALKSMSTRAAQDKIGMIIGEEAAAKLAKEMDRAFKAFGLRAAVADNSATFARTAINDSIKAMTEDGIMNALRSGDIPRTVGQAVQLGFGNSAARKTAATDKTYEELVRALLSSGPEAQKIVRSLSDGSVVIPEKAEKTGRLAEMLLRRGARLTPAAQE